MSEELENKTASLDFIRTIIEDDNKSGKHEGRVHTRFPPEPNGYPHIGHAKSICLNFGIADQYKGLCNLRFDDDQFRRMKTGEFEDGSRTLRAKIDMSSGNINMRDPSVYRIQRTTHHRTGDGWFIYPMYDFAHCCSDSLEGITQTGSGEAPEGRKVKGTLHWVSAAHAVNARVRLYNHLFTAENPGEVDEGQDFTAHLNPEAVELLEDCTLEPSLGESKPLDHFQFLGHGYFCTDTDSTPGNPIFNRTVGLRASWARIQRKK